MKDPIIVWVLDRPRTREFVDDISRHLVNVAVFDDENDWRMRDDLFGPDRWWYTTVHGATGNINRIKTNLRQLAAAPSEEGAE